MLKLKTSLKSEAFVYDFRKDGGTVDVPIKTGLIFPISVFIPSFKFSSIDALVGAGATIEFFLGIVSFGNPTIATINGNGTTGATARPLTTVVAELIIVPRVADITAGSFACLFLYGQTRLG